jgi:hypothetical protein
MRGHPGSRRATLAPGALHLAQDGEQDGAHGAVRRREQEIVEVADELVAQAEAMT